MKYYITKANFPECNPAPKDEKKAQLQPPRQENLNHQRKALVGDIYIRPTPGRRLFFIPRAHVKSYK